jgi:putative ABC transport system permease protein
VEKKSKNPKIAFWLLHCFRNKTDHESLFGDYEEMFQLDSEEFGYQIARVKFWLQVLKALPNFFTNSIYWSMIMFKNYFKIAVRTLYKHKFFSIINVFGLALCLSFCLLVIVIIIDQNSLDQFHPKKGDIYRVLTAAHRKSGDIEKYASTPHPLGSVLEDEIPAVEKLVSLTNGLSRDANYNQVTIQVKSFFANPTFFEIFGFQLANGNPKTALSLPNSMVVTTETAVKIFGEEEPIGKTISVKGLMDFTVTGVLEPFPGKTHFEFDVLGSSTALSGLQQGKKIPSILNDWNNYYFSYNYFRLRPGHSIDEVTNTLETIPKKYYGELKLESRDKSYSFEVQPLTKITPGPILSNGLGNAMPDIMLYFLSGLALLGITAAIFNYTNLTLARSLTRAKEVGIRKVSGAVRPQLFVQFLVESLLIVLVAFAGAVVFLHTLLIPGFQNLQMAGGMNIDFTLSTKVYLYAFAFTFFIGIFAGLLPATVISKFRPAQVLKDISKIKIISKVSLRKVLIVFQFTLSMILLIVVTGIYKQINYALQIDYGFNWKNMVSIDLQENSYQLVAQEMSRNSAVTNYSAVSHNMGTWEDKTVDVRKSIEADPVSVRDYSVDGRFLNNFGLTLVAGSNFSVEPETKNENLVLVNQRFIENFKLGSAHDAIGKTLILGDSSAAQIAGVIKDFLYKPLTYDLEPMLLNYDPGTWRVLNLKIQSTNITETMIQLEKVWRTIDPIHTFSFRLYDNILHEVYSLFRDMMLIVGFLTLLASVVSLLGLLGIATFNAESRIKEIGIRKVLGANLKNLIILLTRHDMFLLSIATVIAVPTSLWIAGMLLGSFAYRIGLGFGVVLPGILTIFILSSLITGWQAIRAVLANPVESLRSE